MYCSVIIVSLAATKAVRAVFDNVFKSVPNIARTVFNDGLISLANFCTIRSRVTRCYIS